MRVLSLRYVVVSTNATRIAKPLANETFQALKTRMAHSAFFPAYPILILTKYPDGSWLKESSPEVRAIRAGENALEVLHEFNVPDDAARVHDAMPDDVVDDEESIHFIVAGYGSIVQEAQRAGPFVPSCGFAHLHPLLLMVFAPFILLAYWLAPLEHRFEAPACAAVLLTAAVGAVARAITSIRRHQALAEAEDPVADYHLV